MYNFLYIVPLRISPEVLAKYKARGHTGIMAGAVPSSLRLGNPTKIH
ncbi:MAG: BrnA antitoxin family protein [Treponema sp.]|nr:BrnA antitoxin family protein [Treponema sp.]